MKKSLILYGLLYNFQLSSFTESKDCHTDIIREDSNDGGGESQYMLKWNRITGFLDIVGV